MLERFGAVHVGNHRLILNGRFTIGPNFHLAFATFLFVVLVNLVVTGLMYDSSIILTILFLIMAKTEILLLISVALTEPGIVPPLSSANNSKDSITSIVNGIKMHQKKCFTCNVFVPPRGKHCGVCGVCVDRHDHHCKFLSNCIGIRNYRSFVLFILNSFLMSLFVALVLVFRSAPIQGIKTWIIFVLSLVFVAITGNLVYYHGKLVLRNSTSYEQHRGFVIDDEEEGENDVHANPFSLGNWQTNLIAFLSTPMEPSKISSQSNTLIAPSVQGRKRQTATAEEMTAVLDSSPMA